MKPIIGAILVSCLTFLEGLASYSFAPRNEILERNGGFQLVLLSSAWLGVCVAGAFLAIYQLHRFFFRARSYAHLFLFSLSFFAALHVFTCARISRPVVGFFSDVLLPRLSSNDTLNLMFADAIFMLLVTAVFFIFLVGAELAWNRFHHFTGPERSSNHVT